MQEKNTSKVTAYSLFPQFMSYIVNRERLVVLDHIFIHGNLKRYDLIGWDGNTSLLI